MILCFLSKCLSKRQIKWKITPNFCGLLRKAELYCVFNTEKVDLFQANKAQEGAKAATGRTVNDVFLQPVA